MNPVLVQHQQPDLGGTAVAGRASTLLTPTASGTRVFVEQMHLITDRRGKFAPDVAPSGS